VTTPLRFAVIGAPVAHSKSPLMHAAAFRALGLPHVYDKIETSEAELASRIEALRQGAFAGLNVTVPHKTRVLALVDEVAGSARAVGAANTLLRGADGHVTAENTDVSALVEELAALREATSLAGTTGIVIGSGGAARAAAFAVATAGARRVVVRARAFQSSERAAAFRQGLALSAVLDVGPLAAPPREDADVACIVQATSCGMDGGSPGDIVADAVAWESLGLATVALDAVYAPRETPFLRRARARGLRATNGLGMLARQGAEALRLWLGIEPPLDAMLAAIR
jgi:shikimate dehydrogenase